MSIWEIFKARIDRRTWLNVNCSIFRAVSEALGSTLSPLAASAIAPRSRRIIAWAVPVGIPFDDRFSGSV